MQGDEEFKTITVRTGTVDAQGDSRKTKRFSGKFLAAKRTFRRARSRDDRGVDYTLYVRANGTYLVYICAWSHWQGESDEYSLHPVEDNQELTDLYPSLANAANIEVVEYLDLKDRKEREDLEAKRS